MAVPARKLHRQKGEELSMTIIRLPIEQYNDLETKNLYTQRLAQGYTPNDGRKE